MADRQQSRANGMTAVVCLAFAVFMVGAAYAAVPLYRLFCQQTGFGGIPKRVSNVEVPETDIPVEVRFDANVRGLPWTFTPVEPRMVIRIGEVATAHYHVENHSDHATSGIASYNVTPDLTGSYFSKLQCFCFTNQKLAPHQSEDLTVTFFVDPALLKDTQISDVRSITLSYSFYPSSSDGKPPLALLETLEGAKPAGQTRLN